jgi:hypothetical protein
VLGVHHYAKVAVSNLRALPERAALPPNMLFAMGQLAQRNSVEALNVRARFERTYRPVVGKQ